MYRLPWLLKGWGWGDPGRLARGINAWLVSFRVSSPEVHGDGEEGAVEGTSSQVCKSNSQGKSLTEPRWLEASMSWGTVVGGEI